MNVKSFLSCLKKKYCWIWSRTRLKNNVSVRLYLNTGITQTNLYCSFFLTKCKVFDKNTHKNCCPCQETQINNINTTRDN